MNAEHLYFDCNASYGAHPHKHIEERWTLEHLLSDLDLAGIAGALVYHQQAVHYDPMLGNLRLCEEISPYHDRLFPCWIALPNLCGDFPSVEEFVAQLEQHDIRAVRIDPYRFGVPVRERVWKELRDALLERNTLCILPASANGTLENLDHLLEIFRNNNTLMVGHGWHQWRLIADLMQEFPNLHLDFSTFQANRAMEVSAEMFGAKRCLFGTDLPFKAPGTARGFIDWTLLDSDSARLIAAENLRRLLGGIGPTELPPQTIWDDELTQAARHSQPLPCPVLDGHCHMLHKGGIAAGQSLVFQHGGPESMVEVTRRIGIAHTAIMSWAAPLSLDTDTGNQAVEYAVRTFPEDFSGVASINAEYDDEEKIDQIIAYYHEELGFPGLKTYTPYQNIDYDDPLYDKWFSYANQHGLYLVYDPKHGSGATQCTRNLAERYPNMGLHLDHCGRSWEFAKWAVEMMHEYPNIWAQLNYTAATNGSVEWIVEQVGADRVLFGSDSPMRDPRPQAAWLTFTRLGEEDKRKIFGGNFARILQEIKDKRKASVENSTPASQYAGTLNGHR